MFERRLLSSKTIWARAASEPELVGPIADPDIQGTADRPATVVIVIVADPERVAAKRRRDGAAKARAGFDSLGHRIFCFLENGNCGRLLTMPREKSTLRA